MSARRVAGAQRLAAEIERHGARCVFGVVGTQNVELFDALRRSRLRVVAATHELAAAFAANGWYRATGEPGVLVTIPGPGFTYALPAIAEARLDSVALVHIVGKPAESPTPRFQLQDIDQASIAAPLVKRVIRVERAAQIGDAIAEAWSCALEGEPGPVLVEVARAALREETDDAAAVPRPETAHALSPEGDAPLSAIVSGRAPALYVGQGVFGAGDALREVAEALDAPVFLTTSARGALAEDHPLACPLDALGGAWDALNAFLAERDPVAILGAKLGHNGSGGYRLKLARERTIQVDSAAHVLNANYPARIAVQSDAPAFLRGLAARLRGRTARNSGGAEAVARLRATAAQAGESTEPRFPTIAPPTAEHLFASLRRALPRDARLVTDSGLHQLLARRHFAVLSPRALLVPTDFQSMGFALPAAMAAAIADPARPVVALLGDGGFAMAGLEALVALREQVRLTIVVFVDGAWGLIRLKQLGESGIPFATEISNPNFPKLAESLGLAHFRVEGDAESVFRRALAHPGVSLVEVPCGDSFSMKTLRAKGAAREAAESLLDSDVVQAIRRTLRGLGGE